QAVGISAQMSRIVTTSETVDQNRDAVTGTPTLGNGVVQDELIAVGDGDPVLLRRVAHGGTAEEVTENCLDVPVPQQPRGAECAGRRSRRTAHRQTSSRSPTRQRG